MQPKIAPNALLKLWITPFCIGSLKHYARSDAETFREAVADHNCDHNPESRLLNAYRISRFANLAARGHA
jgi:hypothetical protein